MLEKLCCLSFYLIIKIFFFLLLQSGTFTDKHKPSIQKQKWKKQVIFCWYCLHYFVFFTLFPSLIFIHLFLPFLLLQCLIYNWFWWLFFNPSLFNSSGFSGLFTRQKYRFKTLCVKYDGKSVRTFGLLKHFSYYLRCIYNFH